MDYSDFTSALKTDDSVRVDELVKSLYPRLMAFLQIHMNADRLDAEDCVQDTLILSMEAIKEGQLKDPDQTISYILTICKNNYLKMQKKRREKYLEELSYGYQQQQAPAQMDSLFDEDRERLLEVCLNQLEERYRIFIEYWFDNPNAPAENAAKLFEISINSVWTRKHRLIKKLNECYRKKSKI